jgi:hypothetical protein
MMNSELGEDPLTSSGFSGSDDASSVSSQRSAGGRSLLERIQMQRQREAASGESSPAVTMALTPQQIQIPNYGPMPGIGNSVPSQSSVGATDGSFLSNAWSSFSLGVDTSPIALPGSSPSDSVHHLEEGMGDALLPPSARMTTDEDYSMSTYFMTFVKDVTGLFNRLHIVPRILVIAALLYLAIKLLYL